MTYHFALYEHVRLFTWINDISVVLPPWHTHKHNAHLFIIISTYTHLYMCTCRHAYTHFKIFITFHHRKCVLVAVIDRRRTTQLRRASTLVLKLYIHTTFTHNTKRRILGGIRITIPDCVRLSQCLCVCVNTCLELYFTYQMMMVLYTYFIDQVE